MTVDASDAPRSPTAQPGAPAPDLPPPRSTTRQKVGHGASVVESRVVALLASRTAVAVVLTLFVLQAGWVAVSSRLSIYDENRHIKTIDAFSRRWTHWVDQQVSEGTLGDLEHYGSFLYHYLMSWPWRIARSVGIDYDDRILVLRLLSVVFVAGGLLAFRQTMQLLEAPPALATVAMLLVALFPLLVFVAGSVNYDNFLFLVLTLFVYTVVRVLRSDQVDVGALLGAVLFAAASGVTKYTALPIVGVLTLVLVVQQLPLLRREGLAPWRAYLGTASTARLVGRVVLALSALVLAFVALERYLGNVVRFGTPFPSCEKSVGVEICEQFSIWRRNQAADAAFADQPTSLSGAATFLQDEWLPRIWRSLTLQGVHAPDGVVMSYGPGIGGVVVLLGSIALVVVLVLTAGLLARVRGAVPVMVAVVVYVAALFWKNYSMSTTTGAVYGVQGRYLLILLPWLVGGAAIGVSRVLAGSTDRARRFSRAALVVFVLGLSTQGAGVFSYLWAADEQWIDDRGTAVQLLGRTGHELARDLVVSDLVISDPR